MRYSEDIDVRNRVLGVGAMALVSAYLKERDSIMESLTLTSNGKGREFTLKLYRVEDDYSIYIPRALVSDSGVAVKGSWEEMRTSANIKLRTEQVSLVTSYLEAIKTFSPYGGIIKAPTGSGKTVIAIAIMARIGLKTLIIVPTDRLMTQWKDQLLALTDLKESDIGIIRGSKRQTGRPVTIAMIHTLAKQYRELESVACAFGLVIYDEIHVLGAETFSRTAPMFNCKYRLGLSATPRRKDGMENVFRWNIGEVVSEYTKLHMSPVVFMLPYRGVDADTHDCTWGGDLILGRYLNKIAWSANRNTLIADAISKAYTKGRNILVLSDRIRQLMALRDVLMSTIEKSDIGLFTGSVKQPDRKIILATYGSAGLGADIPRLDTLVFATPRTDMEQAVGRILRKYNPEHPPVVIDVVDTHSQIMRIWAFKRLKFYRKISNNIINKM